MSLDLITDRTYEDALYATAHRDSPTPLKGAYNAADFNRVGEALNYLSGWLYSLGYGLYPQLRTDWAATDNMTYADAVNYLSVIRRVKESFSVMGATPALPDGMHELFDAGGHEKANDIEKVLLDIEILIERMTKTINLGWAMGIAHIGLYGGI